MPKSKNGLILRGNTWHIDKRCKYAPGGRIRGSTGTSKEKEAREYLNHLLDQYRQSALFGIRPKRKFIEAATKFLKENQHLKSIGDIALHLKNLGPYINHLDISQVHDDALARFKMDMKEAGPKGYPLSDKSINNALQVVRRILNLAARSWRDENGLTWLDSAPLITLPKPTPKRKPYPLSFEEQTNLFKELPGYLEKMALFKVNTGTREQEVCGLKWSYEIPVPALNTSVFIIPGREVKNEEDRLIVLNKVALSVIDGQRDNQSEYVFTYRGRPLKSMRVTSWLEAWEKANLPSNGFLKGVHNLKHTFGRRLRAAGVPVETRRVLLGHTNGDITTHYSAAELGELIDAANSVCSENVRKTPTLTILKTGLG